MDGPTLDRCGQGVKESPKLLAANDRFGWRVQPVGAGTVVGTQVVARAPGDGYTLLVMARYAKVVREAGIKAD